MSFKLYTYQNNYRAWKALIAAAYNGIPIEVPEFKLNEDNRSPEFLAKNPTGKVPVIDTPNGPLFESNAIARYVARLRPDTGLYGSSFFESGQIDQWIDFTTFEVEAPRMIWLYPIYGYMAYDAEAYASAKEDMAKALKTLNNHLASRTYLVGQQITLADIILAAALVDLYARVFEPSFRAPFVHVNRWFNTIINQPKVAGVIGKVEFATKETKAANAGAAKPKAEKKPEAPKEEVKAAPAAAAAAEEEEENFEDAKPKVAAYPTGNINLEAVKRGFMNSKEDRHAWFTEFWQTFDHTGCSVYRSEYNYNSDNTVRFMTFNLVGGFLQRLESLRKGALGACFVHAADPEKAPFNVTGVWIFNTAGVHPEMTACDDSEYHTFTKIDVSTPEGQAEVEALFGAETYKGETVVERRFFH